VEDQVTAFKHGDEYDYWNASKLVREEGRKYVFGKSLKERTVSCDASKQLLGSDMTWMQLCGNLDGQLLYGLPADAADVNGAVFPRDFYLWCQRYVAFARMNKPGANASTLAKLCWTLDVLSMVTYGVAALNLVIFVEDGGHTGRVIDDFFRSRLLPLNSGGTTYVDAYNKALSYLSQVPAAVSFNDQKALAARFNYKAGSSPAVAAIPLLPVPYMKRAAQPTHTSHMPELPLRASFNTNVRPWVGKTFGVAASDKGDFSTAAGNEPVQRAIQQWALWRWSQGAVPSSWYLATDAKGAMKPFLAYAAAVAADSGERAGVPAVFDPTTLVFWPTFATLYNGSLLNGVGYIDGYLDYFVKLEYDVVTKLAAAIWMAQMTPQLPSSPIMVTTGTKVVKASDACGADSARALMVTNPVTFGDRLALEKGDRKAAVAAMKAAMANPGTQAKTDTARQAVKAYGAISSYTKLPPVAAFQKLVNLGMTALVNKLGAAIGFNPCDPPYVVIPAMFTQSIDAAHWRMVPDGSTGDVLARMVEAMINYEHVAKIDFGLYDDTWTENVAATVATDIRNSQGRAQMSMIDGTYLKPKPAPAKPPAAAPAAAAKPAAVVPAAPVLDTAAALHAVKTMQLVKAVGGWEYLLLRSLLRK
jgi:hypothetical protein